MEHKLVIVEFVNGILRKILGLFGNHVEPGIDIIPSHIVLALIATLIIIVFFKLTVKNLSIFPGKMQNFLEMLYTAFRGMIDDAIGEEGRKFLPVIATMGIFIAVSNLMGLLPELGSPTANLNVTVGCAFFVFVYYHYQGIRKHGFFGYLKTFTGPIWWLAILFVPIEIISHFSRPLSLSIRLYGNIFGEDMVIIIIASLVPFIAPIPIMGLAVITSLLQAYIFVMLTTIYLAGAMESEH
ncbi:MAG: F0F1 ATP synthase subunit A [Candidatus Aminicenantes bacterium]|nr:F0F1 ATP synthase subunit A [Candidatus Aminicenantes bacterium]